MSERTRPSGLTELISSVNRVAASIYPVPDKQSPHIELSFPQKIIPLLAVGALGLAACTPPVNAATQEVTPPPAISAQAPTKIENTSTVPPATEVAPIPAATETPVPDFSKPSIFKDLFLGQYKNPDGSLQSAGTIPGYNSEVNTYYREGSPLAAAFGIDNNWLTTEYFHASIDKSGVTRGTTPDGKPVIQQGNVWVIEQTGETFVPYVPSIAGKPFGYPVITADNKFALVDNQGKTIEGGEPHDLFQKPSDIAKAYGYTGDPTDVASVDLSTSGVLVVHGKTGQEQRLTFFNKEVKVETLPATISSVNEFANAMKAAGIEVIPKQILEKGLTIQEKTGVDGKKYQTASTADGYPLMVKGENGEWEEVTIKNLANIEGVNVGVYVGSYGVAEGWQKRNEVQKREFNAGLVSIDWSQLQTKDGVVFPEWVNQDLSIATSSGMNETYFHAMTWFPKTPDYLRSLPVDQVKQEVSTYIQDFVKKYSNSGKKDIFNVVNEAFYTYGGGDVLMQKLGKDYVLFLFEEAAKAAKPGDMLIYNDYNILPGVSSQEGVRNDVVMEILQELQGSEVIQQSGVKIGLGIQAHLIGGANLAPQDIASIIDSYGVPVIITEADVVMDQDRKPDRLETQSKDYEALMAGVLLSKNCKSIYIFGTDDAASWFERDPKLPHYSKNADPMLFNDDFTKKASYYGITKALLEGLMNTK